MDPRETRVLTHHGEPPGKPPLVGYNGSSTSRCCGAGQGLGQAINHPGEGIDSRSSNVLRRVVVVVDTRSRRPGPSMQWSCPGIGPLDASAHTRRKALWRTTSRHVLDMAEILRTKVRPSLYSFALSDVPICGALLRQGVRRVELPMPISPSFKS